MSERRLALATAKTKTTRQHTQGSLLWDELIGKLRKPLSTQDKEAGGLWFFGRLDGTRQRSGDHVRSRSLVVLDADHDAADLPARVASLGCSAVLYPTHSHTETAPRYRVLVQPDRDLLPSEYPTVARHVMTALGGELDPSSATVQQAIFAPATTDPRAYRRAFRVYAGEPLAVDTLLAAAPSELPRPGAGEPPHGPDEDTPYADLPPQKAAEADAKTRQVIDGLRRRLTDAEDWPDGETDERGRGWDRLCADAALALAQLGLAAWSPLSLPDAEALYGELVPEAMATAVPSKWENKAATARRRPLPAPWDDPTWTSAADVFNELPEEEESDSSRPALFADVAAFLSGDGPKAPERTVCPRTDGEHLFYTGQVNVVFGDPESGKTWLALYSGAEALRSEQRVAFIDLDHNGLGATIERLLLLGVPRAKLVDPAVFRYVEPDDADHLRAVVGALAAWEAAVVVVDSIGELLPLLGLSSNSPDDFTVAHAAALKPLARAGATVLAIDHLAKNPDSRKSGPTGTTAKRRAVGGVSLRVVPVEQFSPGRGGRASLFVNKDRHGGLRAVCPATGGEQYAGTLVLTSSELGTQAHVSAPTEGQGDVAAEAAADVAALNELDPEPQSVRDVRDRMKWGGPRAQAALKTWRTLRRLGVQEDDDDLGGLL